MEQNIDEPQVGRANGNIKLEIGEKHSMISNTMIW